MPESVQYSEPVTPSPCVVILLEDCVPAEMTVRAYCVQMVRYVFDLLRYQTASTALTTMRFVKKGTALSQLVLTFANDVVLATRVLVQLQLAGLVAGFGPPQQQQQEAASPEEMSEYGYPPANATFQVVDYGMRLNDGEGISSEEVAALLAPLSSHGGRAHGAPSSHRPPSSSHSHNHSSSRVLHRPLHTTTHAEVVEEEEEETSAWEHSDADDSDGPSSHMSTLHPHHAQDISVIEGYEPGVFYAAVRRPETVFFFYGIPSVPIAFRVTSTSATGWW